MNENKIFQGTEDEHDLQGWMNQLATTDPDEADYEADLDHDHASFADNGLACPYCQEDEPESKPIRTGWALGDEHIPEDEYGSAEDDSLLEDDEDTPYFAGGMSLREDRIRDRTDD
jgi:hypothetical protein